MVTAMNKTEPESRVLQPDASGDTHAVSAPVQTRDSARQLKLDFRAPVLQMVSPYARAAYTSGAQRLTIQRKSRIESPNFPAACNSALRRLPA